MTCFSSYHLTFAYRNYYISSTNNSKHFWLDHNIKQNHNLFNLIMSSTLSDAFRGKRLNLQHKLLDFTSLKELPDLYTWTEPDEYPAGQSLASESVPVIDLDGPTAVNVNLIGHACKTWGVFQVINHGIPTALLHNAMCTSRSLFTLPTEQKLKVARSPDAFEGYGFARISSFFSKRMWYEGFTNVGSPLDHFRQLWPQDYNMHW